MKYIWPCAALLVLVTACSPKTTEVAIPPLSPETPDPPIRERLTSCTVFDDLSRSDRDQAETSYVLYRDFLKAGDLDEAILHWRRAYRLAPGSNGRVKYQYDDGVKIFEQLHSQATDATLKASYVDTIMMIYDKREECFGDPSYVAGRKAFDYYYKYPYEGTSDETFALFKKALQGQGADVDYFVINPFTKMLFDSIVEEQISNAEALPLAKQLTATIKKGKATCEGSLCDAWTTIDEYASARLDALEGVDGFYDCAYYTDKYYSQYESDADNCETIELAYRRMLRGDCPIDHPELTAVKTAKDEKCYTPPPPPGNLRQGFDCYTSGDYRCAVEKFEAFIKSTDDVEKKAKYLLTIAKIYYGDIRDFPTSRKYARQAAELKPNWGEPYILIGKLYASSGPLCGPGTGWDSQVVTWVAIDKFRYAKKIDSSVASEANKWINEYRKYMPSGEDIFVRTNINEGDSYRVGCWINETTTVRKAP